MDQRSGELGRRIVAAAQMAVAVHLYEKARCAQAQWNQSIIGGAGEGLIVANDEGATVDHAPREHSGRSNLL